MSVPTSRPKVSVAVHKPTPYTFDLGLLLGLDANPLPKTDSTNLESVLAETAREGAQSLVNQLLTTCPITSSVDGVILSLPQVSTPLPREKPVPMPKPPTTWQKFAAKRGIKPKTRDQRKNLAFDEDSGEWKRKWGYKGLNKKGEDDWVMEVDMKAERERKEGTTIRGDGRRERKENIKRNERKQRKNERDRQQGRK